MGRRVFPFVILLFSGMLCLTAFLLPLLSGCSLKMVSGMFRPAGIPFVTAVASAALFSVFLRILLYFKNKHSSI